MSGVMAISRSPAKSVPKPEQGHLALINIWISYISESGYQAVSNVFQDNLILYQSQQSCEDSQLRRTYQSGHERETWACTMCGVWLTMHYAKKDELNF